MPLLDSSKAVQRTQAAGLATKPPANGPRVFAVASGKGGVGKSTIAVNLGMAMLEAQRRTMLLDADLGLANVDVLLGLQPAANLSHVLEGKCTLSETIIEGPNGLKIVPASSGRRRMSELTRSEHVGLIGAFSGLTDPIDVMLVDTAAGLSNSVQTFCQASQEVLIVVCNEPASLTDAYALIKVLSRDCGIPRMQLIANRVKTPGEGREVYDNLCRVADRFLDVTLNYLGHVPEDDKIVRSARQQRPVIDAYPGAPSAQAFRSIASKLLEIAPQRGARGHIEFFVERLVDSGVGMAMTA